MLPVSSVTSVIMQLYLTLLLLPLVKADEGYKVWMESLIDCGSEKAPMTDLSSIKVSHHNRTSMAIKGDAKVLATVTTDTKMRMVGYMKSTHGSWTKQIVDTKVVSVCDYIQKDEYFWPSMVLISDLPRTCPIEEGVYSFKDATLRMEKLPPFVPKGCYKLVFHLWSGELTSCNVAYVKVAGPNDSPNPRCT